MQFVITNDNINIFIIDESNSEIRDYNLFKFVITDSKISCNDFF